MRTTVNGTLKDIFVAAIDNIRVSEPPADVIMDKGVTPFNVYPSINSSMNLQFRIDNVPGPSTTISATRTNVLLVSRWNYLNQKTTAWVTNAMQCVSIGDGLGNGELWQPQTPMSVFPDAGDLEYYFLCYFNGTYYQSYDYTVYPPVLTPALFPPENKSPRLYNASGITALSGTPTNNFIFPLRLFPSSHDSVTAMLSANGQPPMALAMTLVGTNKWQAKYDVVNYPGVTNLLWYFEATGAYTNAFTTTSEKSYWQNTNLSRIQNGALPYGDNCGVTDGTITNRPSDWFGVTVTPGESSYVMFTLDTAKPSYLAGRGEYQNFNGWNMGAAAQNFFTDSDDKYPKVSYSQNFSSGWSPSYLTGLSNWFGTVTFDGQTATLRTGPEPVLDQSMYWNAGTFQYLVERTAIAGFVADAEFASQRRNQGIRLFGNEGNPALGAGYYQGSAQQQNGINGVGTVIYKARLSRPLATDTKYNINVAWRKTDMQRTNYVIRTSMYATSMSPERPSMSMIAYYQDMYRFYEYRITQEADSRDIGAIPSVNAGWDKRLRHEIWKWDGTMTPKLLASLVRTASGVDGNWDVKLTDSATFNTYMTEFHVYNATSTATRLKVRCKQTDITGWTLSNGATASGAVIEDANTPLNYGSYGFHSADCAIWIPVMTINGLGSSGFEDLAAPVSVLGTPSEWYIATDLYQVQPGSGFISKPLSTIVNVLTGTSELGPWTPFKSQTVNSYYYQTFAATTNAWNSLCAKIQVIGSTGVAIDGVLVQSWHGETIQATPSDGWKITEGWLSYTAPYWFAHFDASQANPNLIQGVRSEQVMGIGSISFDYRVNAAPAQIKIQYTANIFPQETSDSGWVDITNLFFNAATGWTSANFYLAIAPATNLYVRIRNNILTNRLASVDLRNIVIWDNPTNSPNDWAAYNMKFTDTETDKWWLDKKTEAFARSGYMNNSTTANTIAGRPMAMFNPYIMAPRLTRGLGSISFLARAFTTGYAAGDTNTSIAVYATTDAWDKYKPDATWTKLYTFTGITNAFYRPFVYSHPTVPNNIQAVKLVVEGPVFPSGALAPQRVCVDEIVLTEDVRPSFEITDVKMLKEGTESTLQPFEGESIAIEAQLTRVQLDPQEINLFVTYVLGTNTWGVTNAPLAQRTTMPMMLVSPGERIYRTQSSLIPPQSKDTVVQYCVWGEYSDNGTHLVYQSPMTANHFFTPPWYSEDLNQTHAPDWSPYYIVAGTNAPLWLSPSIQNVPYTGGVFTVFVGALSNWTANSTAPWIMPSEPSGNLAARTPYHIAPNPLKTARSAVLTFTCGLLAESVAIHQDPAPFNLDAVVGPTGFNWSMGGDMLWFEQSQTVKEGASALQSGAITNNQLSWVETTITGPGTLSFWWRVSSEGGYDFLTCALDGLPQKIISGSKIGWVQEQFSIGTGSHVVRWTYSKDESGSEGDDCGWLDALQWLPTNPLSGFALWVSNLGLPGNHPDIFIQDRNHDGIANGFEYAFGTNLPLSSLLINLRFIDGRAIVETPKQDDATLPYVDIRVKGSTNLLDWTLPMIPATDTTGKPAYQSWHEPEGTPPAKAFFKLEAELK